MRIVCDHELWPIEKVIPYHANIKKHPEAQINKLASMITEYGWDVPLVSDAAGVLIKGHGRLEAAKKLGLKEVPVIVRTDLTPAQVKAARIADNKVAESEWDLDNLKLEMGELDALDFDLDLTGFEEDEQEKLLAEPLGDGGGLTDPDAVPENVETRCKPGDLWELGGHRLLCGDSTNIQHVERLMGGEKADMAFTDPPYGMNAVSKDGKVGGSNQAPARTYRPVLGDEDTTVAKDAYNVLAALEIQKMFIWGGNYFTDFLPPSPCWVVWDKQRPEGLTFADGEVAWTNLTTPLKFIRHRWDGFIRASERNEDRVHPTQKPTFLAEWCFNEYGKANDTVIDLFLGSGSTLIACEKTNRRCFGMELDAKYVSVAIERWMKFTGKMAYLVNDDGTQTAWEDIDAKR